MSELQSFKCKNCGALFQAATNENGVLKCEYCDSIFTIPKKDSNNEVLQFLQIGEHNLDACHFDEAYTAFEKASQLNDKEPEAYWGMALAEFKVQYIKDAVNNRLQPICHEFNDKEFQANKNYLKALKCAGVEQKSEYFSKAQDIDYIREEFLKLQQTGLDYDCFICVKVSQTDVEQADISKKNWTNDAYNADSIYDLLKRHDFRPFFSEREIKGRSGANYEAMILYALYTAETMLVVCSDEEYLRTPWVKNEYTRFKSLIKNEEKENDSLTIVYNGKPIDRLPGDNNGRIQGIDYSKREADFEIVKFVQNHTPIARAKREEEERRKHSQNEEIKKQIEEQKRAQKELEERLKNFNSQSTGATVGTLLTRAKQELEVNNFEKARMYFEKALECNPENADAWFGLMLLDHNCVNFDGLLAKLNNAFDSNNCEFFLDVVKNRNFIICQKYADGNIAEKLESIKFDCENKINILLKKENIDLDNIEFYQRILLQNQSNIDALYALLLTSNDCVSKEELLAKINHCNNVNNYSILFDLKDQPEFVKAMQLADEDLSDELDEYISACNQKIEQLLEEDKTNLKASHFYVNVIKEMPNNVVAKYRLFLIDFGCINEQEMFDKIVSDDSIINQLYNSPDFVYLTNCDDVEIKNRANSFKQLIKTKLHLNKKAIEFNDLQQKCEAKQVKFSTFVPNIVIFITSLIVVLIIGLNIGNVRFLYNYFGLIAIFVCMAVIIIMNCIKAKSWKQAWLIILFPIGVVYAAVLAVLNIIPFVKGLFSSLSNVLYTSPLKRRMKELQYDIYECKSEIEKVRKEINCY